MEPNETLNNSTNDDKPSYTPAVINALDWGYTKDGKVYKKGLNGKPDKVIGEVRNSDEFSLQYFVNRFHVLEAKVYQLVFDVETAVNKGSFLMKLLHLKEQLDDYDALGDVKPLHKLLDDSRDGIESIIANNRVRNTETKKNLIVDLKQALETLSEYRELSDKVKEIRERWLKTGAADKSVEDEYNAEFEGLLDGYYDLRRKYIEERQKLTDERMVIYDALMERAKKLTDPTGNAFHAMKNLKALQEEFRGVGAVPKIQYTQLKTDFKNIQRMVMRNFRYQKRKKDMAAPLTKADQEAVELREKMIAEAVALQQLDTRESFGKAKELLNVWKNLPRTTLNETRQKILNDKFTYITDRIFEMSYLMKTVYTTYRFFNGKPLIEQYTLKIKTIKDIITKDENEVKDMQARLDRITHDERMQPENKQLYGRMKTQERKLRVKNLLMKELQDQLDAL